MSFPHSLQNIPSKYQGERYLTRPGSVWLAAVLSGCQVCYSAAGRWRILAGVVAAGARATRHLAAGGIVASGLAGGMATAGGRGAVPRISARSAGPLHLGAARPVRGQHGKWCHLMPVHARALAIPSTALGDRRADSLARFRLFPRPLRKCLSIDNPACRLQCGIFPAHRSSSVGCTVASAVSPRGAVLILFQLAGSSSTSTSYAVMYSARPFTCICPRGRVGTYAFTRS